MKIARFTLLAVALFAVTRPASAVTHVGYAAGSGANLSQVVIDFGFAGGDAYVFDYHYDGDKTGLDMLMALDAAGSLELFVDVFTFGTSVRGFAYDGNTANTGFNSETGQFWSYHVDGGSQDLDFDGSFTLEEVTASGAYLEASVGAGGRLLSNGSIDGYIENISSFNSLGNPASSNTPASVPEPTSLALLGGVLWVTLRRRRAQA
ncbi:MAG: PEP-CTERM sorting domain-containing protein [Algisphaera sp.]